MDDMSPPSDHRGSEVLDAAECDRLLTDTPVGRVSFLGDGEPQILPVNYRYRGNAIVIRTTVGSKMDAAEMHNRFAFEIDGWDADGRTGWSVVVHGHGRVVEDEAEIAELERLGLEPWTKNRGGDLWIEILVDDITGRRV